MSKLLHVFEAAVSCLLLSIFYNIFYILLFTNKFGDYNIANQNCLPNENNLTKHNVYRTNTALPHLYFQKK